MKQPIKLASFLVVISFMIASCSPAATSQLLNKVNPQVSSTPGSQPTQQQATQAPQSTPVVAVTGNSQGPVASSEAVAAVEGVYEQVYTQVNPSVVNIQVSQTVAANSTPGFNFFGQQGNTPQQGQQVQRGLGSGFIWDTQGHIVTNNHVVEGADKVTVTFMDGTTLPAKVVGTDVNSDLAVVQVDAPANLLKPVTMADSNQVKVGQMAIAIGNPFGLEGSMTVGIVSAIGRSLPVNNSSTTAAAPSYTIPDIIQTDAPINPGNSGGVLTDNSGKVIGVTAAIESQSGSNAGIGFAVPADLVKNVVPSLISSGKYEYTWLGISGTTLSPDLAKAMNVDQNQRGILVGDVTSGSPADKAGIKPSTKDVTVDSLPGRVGGDIITQIDGQKLNRFEDMVSYLAKSTKVGQTVTLTVLRDNKEQNVSVTLEARPAEQPASSLPSLPGSLPGSPLNPGNPGNATPGSPNQAPAGTAFLGISATDVTPDVAQQLNIDPSVKGILVVSVANGSPAADAGLQASSNSKAGDIITGVDNTAITSFSDFKNFLSQKQPGDQITLQVLRDGKQISVDVTLGSR